MIRRRMGTFWYNGVKSQNIKAAWFANRTLGCIPGTPRLIYDEGASNVVWAAVHNQFFALAAIPIQCRAANGHSTKSRVPAAGIDGPDQCHQRSPDQWLSGGLRLPGRAFCRRTRAWQTGFTFYAGSEGIQAPGANRPGDGQQPGPDHGFHRAVLGFFSKLLLLSMNGLHALGLPYGWTIIAITLIIKVLFWPLTKASTRSQKRMQALQPQIKAIADKYKDDPVKKNQKTMEFCKEHKVSPLGSCLPTLLQIPVFFGFYWMLRNAIELRGTHFLWAYDLSQPDTVAYLAGFPINPLPLDHGRDATVAGRT